MANVSYEKRLKKKIFLEILHTHLTEELEEDKGLSAPDLKKLLKQKDTGNVRDHADHLCEVKLKPKNKKGLQMIPSPKPLYKKEYTHKKPRPLSTEPKGEFKYKRDNVTENRYYLIWKNVPAYATLLLLPDNTEHQFDLDDNILERVRNIMESEGFKESYIEAKKQGKLLYFFDIFFSTNLLKYGNISEEHKTLIKEIEKWKEANINFTKDFNNPLNDPSYPDFWGSQVYDILKPILTYDNTKKQPEKPSD